MLAGIDRYLKENESTFIILKDTEFKGAKDALEGKAKYLRTNLVWEKNLKEENILCESGHRKGQVADQHPYVSYLPSISTFVRGKNTTQ